MLIVHFKHLWSMKQCYRMENTKRYTSFGQQCEALWPWNNHGTKWVYTWQMNVGCFHVTVSMCTFIYMCSYMCVYIWNSVCTHWRGNRFIIDNGYTGCIFLIFTFKVYVWKKYNHHYLAWQTTQRENENVLLLQRYPSIPVCVFASFLFVVLCSEQSAHFDLKKKNKQVKIN